MSSGNLHISTQFTEDVIAKTPSKCERPSCQAIIQVGDQRIYLASQNPNVSGKYVCKACFDHYARKSVTLARVVHEDSASSTSIQTKQREESNAVASAKLTPVSARLINISDVQQMINEGQRKGANTPQGRVTSMPPSSSSVVGGPNIHNPSYFQNFFSHHSTPSISASGYSASHALYAQEHKRWSTAAYKGSLAPGQIPVNAQTKAMVPIVAGVGYELLLGKTEQTGIKEGISVDYGLTPQELAQAIRSCVIKPLTKLFPGFPWDFSKSRVRETAIWQDILANRDLTEPYFQGRFLKAKSGKSAAGTYTFSPPNKPVSFIVIIDRNQWIEAERMTQDSDAAYVPEPKRLIESVASDSSEKHTHQHDHAFPLTRKRKELASPHSTTDNSDIRKRREPANSHQTIDTSDAFSTLSYVEDEYSFDKKNQNNTNNTGESVQFKSLDANEVTRGLLLGGQQSVLELKQRFDAIRIESILCYPIVFTPFHDLGSNNQSSIISSKGYFAQLSFNDHTDFISKGGFKTAHSALLEWTSASPSGLLGSWLTSPISIAMKRLYTQRKDPKTGAMVLKRFAYADESIKTLMEATSLAYADSILQFAYGFINNFLNKQGSNLDSDDLPFSIPKLRFVKACIAYSFGKGKQQAASTSYSAAYLLEELIPTELPFIKYIHNADAVPLLEESEPGYDTSKFLCFVQHVQFVESHGQVFLSDFQGAGDLLTDPQVMTHPKLKDGNGNPLQNLFGEGNVEEAFMKFPSQHKCNEYCTWFDLEPINTE
ncbi:Myosin heavy chain kinase C [Psilocybe cubensis]|uniref:Alpha-type protein kinase domain-containing protein n=2 Tax=Psilocybe cubensis TaxID=181762 RepID=A0A8H7XZ10_PSICU|nr:Myosin heavy chain kinase C [Psilocybe cubensis]KAH9481781.1 Myosin heavy chain kinase C [Psilocybe cubensis]